MDELGELLELLYGARHRFRTARGVLLYRWSHRLTMEAMKREEARRKQRGGSQSQIMFATRAGDEPEPPDLHEERTRFWWEPPDRLREEVESDAKPARTTVIDGELWWMYMPEWGAISNVELSDEERAHHVVGRGESFRPALDPSGLIGVLEIDSVEVEGDRLHVRARPRDDLDGSWSAHFQLRLAVGADAYELVVDRERGTVLRLVAYLEGEEIAVTEIEQRRLRRGLPGGHVRVRAAAG